MSLPKEILEQLLSGYLDDALSADERARVEQLMQSNAEVADELAHLRELHESLQAVARADSVFKLNDGFADRVVEAAVARARAEGLGDDHPLIRVAEQPSTTRVATRGSSRRMVGLLVALAASVAIAVITLTPGSSEPNGVASVDGQAGIEVPDDNPSHVPDVGIENPGTASVELIAGLETGPSRSVSNKPQPLETNDAVVDVPNQPAPPRAPDNAVASSPPSSMNTKEPPTAAKIEVPQTDMVATDVGAIIVLHVKRTDSGRQTDAVGEAMRLVSIDPASEKKITEEIAGLTGAQPKDQKVSVLYLQASAKQIDQFYLRLMADQKGIESVGISIAADAPIMKVVDSVRSDPTMVRHSSLELISDNGVVDGLTNQLDQLPFAPLSRAFMSSMQSNGPDEASQVLVLVE